MVNYRPLREQRASHTYKRPLTRRASLERQASGEQDAQRVRRTQAKQYQQRVVTLAQEVEPAEAWGDFERRREERFRTRQRQQTYTGMVPRRMSQSGQLGHGSGTPPRRQLPPYKGSPVPRRGGQRRGFLWKLLGFLAFAVVAVLGSSFALAGTAFRIEQVNVTGTHNSALVQSIQNMGVQGQNIFLVDVASLTARVKALPTVSEASVTRQWPNQLSVAVSERVPVLLWQTKYGAYSVDTQGVVIALASETPGANRLMAVVDTRIVTGKANGKTQRIQPGSHLNAADVRFAQQVLSRLPQLTGLSAFTLDYTDSIAVAPGEAGSFVIVSPTGWRAYLGGTGDSNPLDNRLLELRQILVLAQQQQLHLATVDLRFGLRPVYTLQS